MTFCSLKWPNVKKIKTEPLVILLQGLASASDVSIHKTRDSSLLRGLVLAASRTALFPCLQKTRIQETI